MKLLHIIILSLLVFFSSSSILCSQEILRVAFPIGPPWRHLSDGEIDGADKYFLTELARRLNAKVIFQVLPFQRCLKEVEMGRSDIISGIHFRSDREQFLIYIRPAYKKKSNKAFYVLKNSGVTIKKYEDLIPLKIGHRMGSKYFPRFDDDPLLKKEAVWDNELNIDKLLKGRIDTFIITSAVGDYYIKHKKLEDRIERAEFAYTHDNPVYFGISKKSPWAKRSEEISAKYSEMVNSGELDRLIESYFIQNSMPIPAYK